MRSFLPSLCVAATLALVACRADEVTGPPAPMGPPPAVGQVTVWAEMTTFGPGDTVRVKATVLDATGTALTGRTVSWTSSDTTVATVDGHGLVTSKFYDFADPSSVTITATAEGYSESLTL